MTARVPPDTRRRQILAEAAHILTESGPEHVQITEVAERTGVSRPLVYRLFPTRQALLRAVLSDFAELLGARFQRALESSQAASVPTMVAAFVEASCDAIEEKGAGPWLLLDPRGADPDLCTLGRASFVELLQPWQQQLSLFLGVPAERAAYLLWIVVAAGRATLAGWIDGIVARADATADATRAVTALLTAFAQAPVASPKLKPARAGKPGRAQGLQSAVRGAGRSGKKGRAR